MTNNLFLYLLFIVYVAAAAIDNSTVSFCNKSGGRPKSIDPR
ncbi:hypothetical protein [Yersinia entomophaga]|nr:hypothetical protein [Yersinia entomophaga]